MKLLVTGASGLLGATLVLTAREKVGDVIAVCGRHRFEPQGVITFQADLSDERTATELIVNLRPHVVIHCAAMADVDACEIRPEDAKRINVGMTGYLMEGVSRVGARMVYISTDHVFDGEKGGYREEDPPAPLNVYALTKLEAEDVVIASGDRHLVVRTNIYGWNFQNKQSLAEWILSRLEAGQRVPGFSDVYFSPILVNDLSDFLLRMISSDLGGLYNVAGGESLSKMEFAVRLARVFGLDATLVDSVLLKDAQLRTPRPRNLTLDTTKIEKALGIAMPSVASGLRRFRELRDNGFVDKLKSSGKGIRDDG